MREGQKDKSAPEKAPIKTYKNCGQIHHPPLFFPLVNLEKMVAINLLIFLVFCQKNVTLKCYSKNISNFTWH
jgi:hypothetical protein